MRMYNFIDREELAVILKGLVDKHTHLSVRSEGEDALIHAVRAETYERVIDLVVRNK